MSKYSLLQHPKKYFEKLTMPKKLKGRTLWDFSTSILSQNSKKIERGSFGGKKLRKQSAQCRKETERGPLSLAWKCMLRQKKEKKPSWFSSLGQMVQFDTIKFCRPSRTIFVTSGVSKKTLTKSHDYSHLFPLEKRRL